MKHIKLQHMEEKDTDSQTRKKQNFLTQTRKTENEMGREREGERKRSSPLYTILPMTRLMDTTSSTFNILYILK